MAHQCVEGAPDIAYIKEIDFSFVDERYQIS